MIHDEDWLEKLYWEFDNYRIQGDERLKFKAYLRGYGTKCAKEALAKQQEPVAWPACTFGAETPAWLNNAPRFLELSEQLKDALNSLAFYRKRCEALQKWQSKMREPERTIVCDILANGCTLEPAGVRYTRPQPAAPQRSEDEKQWVGLTDVEWMNIVNKDHAWFGHRPEDVAHEVAKLVEAKLKEKSEGQPPRQPLTDEQIEELMDTYDVASIDYARAIEAAHGIKENT
jgi:hypothetical protein